MIWFNNEAAAAAVLENGAQDWAWGCQGKRGVVNIESLARLVGAAAVAVEFWLIVK
jgi:hypothetical protein